MAGRQTTKKISHTSKAIRRLERRNGNSVSDCMAKNMVDEAKAAPSTVIVPTLRLRECPTTNSDKTDAVVVTPVLESLVSNPITIIQLNDDCLLEILHNLPFFYLNKVAQTCTRLLYMARLLFAKMYNDDRLTYKKIKIMFYDDEIRNFGPLAEKMWLGGSENSLRLMVENNCGDSLRRLIFGHIHKVDFRRIRNVERIFENLTELAFFKCCSLTNMPVNKCTELTKLEIYGKFLEDHMLGDYEKLKFFRCEYDSTDPAEVMAFLIKHPYLKEVILHSYNSAMVPMPELEKLIIRHFTMDKHATMQRLPKLKVLEIGFYRDDENNANKLKRFLNASVDPEVLTELRIPRLRCSEPPDRRNERLLNFITRNTRMHSMDNLVEAIGKLIKLQTLKIDMHDLGGNTVRHWHGLTELRHLKLKDTQHIQEMAMIEWLSFLPKLETLSFYNTNEIRLLLGPEDNISPRIRNMYRMRPQQFTINYFKRPINSSVITEDYCEDVYELCQQQMPFHKYKVIEFNVKATPT